MVLGKSSQTWILVKGLLEVVLSLVLAVLYPPHPSGPSRWAVGNWPTRKRGRSIPGRRHRGHETRAWVKPAYVF